MSYSFLVVHRSATTRALLKRMLRSTEFPIGAIFDTDGADEAMETLAAQRVDVVLADLNAAGGADLIERILSDPETRTVPVVAICNRPEPRQIARLRRHGMKGCLLGSISVATLKTILGPVLEPTHV